MKKSINVDNLNRDLVTASIYGVYKLVELLLDSGADPEEVDLRAVKSGEIKQLILEARRSVQNVV